MKSSLLEFESTLVPKEVEDFGQRENITAAFGWFGAKNRFLPYASSSSSLGGGEVIGVKLVVVRGESGLVADRLLNRVRPKGTGGPLDKFPTIGNFWE